jgi:anti-sigma factor RsiW
MNTCRDVAGRLTSYVDDLLPDPDRAEVERHLAACASCRRGAGAERAAKTVLRDRAAILRESPLPPGLRARCEALVQEAGKAGTAGTTGWLGRLVPVSVTAVLVLFTIAAVFTLATRRSSTVFADRLTADHIRCVQQSGSVETASADATRLETVLRELYGWQVHVPPSSSDDGIELRGAQRCLYGDGSVPRVVYRTGGADVSLYMMEGVTRGEADVTTQGYRSRVWSRGGTTFVLVSPEEAGDLAPAVEYLMREAE